MRQIRAISTPIVSFLTTYLWCLRCSLINLRISALMIGQVWDLSGLWWATWGAMHFLDVTWRADVCLWVALSRVHSISGLRLWLNGVWPFVGKLVRAKRCLAKKFLRLSELLWLIGVSCTWVIGSKWKAWRLVIVLEFALLLTLPLLPRCCGRIAVLLVRSKRWLLWNTRWYVCRWETT